MLQQLGKKKDKLQKPYFKGHQRTVGTEKEELIQGELRLLVSFSLGHLWSLGIGWRLSLVYRNYWGHSSCHYRLESRCEAHFSYGILAKCWGRLRGGDGGGWACLGAWAGKAAQDLHLLVFGGWSLTGEKGLQKHKIDLTLKITKNRGVLSPTKAATHPNSAQFLIGLRHHPFKIYV